MLVARAGMLIARASVLGAPVGMFVALWLYWLSVRASVERGWLSVRAFWLHARAGVLAVRAGVFIAHFDNPV